MGIESRRLARVAERHGGPVRWASVLTTSGVAVDSEAVFLGFLVQPTSDMTLTFYDNASAARGDELAIGGIEVSSAVGLMDIVLRPEIAQNGIYVNITGTGKVRVAYDQ